MTAAGLRAAGRKKMLGDAGGSSRTKEHAKPLPKPGKGAVCQQFKECGNPGCRCAGGELHGPYFYLFWRERGKLRKRYLRPAEVEAIRAECEARRGRERQRRAALREWEQQWRELRTLLREVIRDG